MASTTKEGSTILRSSPLTRTEASFTSRPLSSRDLNFPVQLHCALEDMERNGESHIAYWRPHGRCFHIHNRDEFAAKILPRWFNMTKFSSFQRQLNIYCFKRVYSGPDEQSLYHEKFLRGLLQLALEIKRVPIKIHAAAAAAAAAAADADARVHQAAETVAAATSASASAPLRQRNRHVPDFYKLPPLPPSRPAVSTDGSVVSTGATDSSFASTIATIEEGPVASAALVPWVSNVFGARDQCRHDMFAVMQSCIVQCRLPPSGPSVAAAGHLPIQASAMATTSLDAIPDAQSILAYLQQQEHEQAMVLRNELLWRLQKQQQQQQLERQSLGAAANLQISSLLPMSVAGAMPPRSTLLAADHMRHQQQSGDLLRRLLQLQGPNAAGR